MIIDVHSHLVKNPDYKSIEKVIKSKVVDQVWIQGLEFLTDVRGFATRKEMLEVKKVFSPFFKIFAYLDFYSSPDEIKKLKDMGFDGLKSHSPGKPYNHSDWFPFYEIAEKEKMPILFHTGNVTNHPIPVDREFYTKYSPDQDFMRPVYMDIIAKLFPDIILIIAHFGGELWQNEAFDMIYSHKNVYTDISGITPYHIEHLNEYMSRRFYYDRSVLISKKFLFACDVKYGMDVLESVKKHRAFWESFLGVYGRDKAWSEDKDKIMGETAKKILGDSQ